MTSLNTDRITQKLEYVLRLRNQKKSISGQIEALVHDISNGRYDATIPVTDQQIAANLRLSALETARLFAATRAGSQSASTLTGHASIFLHFLTNGTSK